MPTEFSELLKLGRAERIQLVEDLWDSIALEEGDLPVPDWKRDELRRRKERFMETSLVRSDLGSSKTKCSRELTGAQPSRLLHCMHDDKEQARTLALQSDTNAD